MKCRFALAAALLLAAVLPATNFVRAAEPKVAVTDPAKADADFAIQGEYAGEIPSQDGPHKVGVQVVALGDGKFHAVGYMNGLPGEGWDKSEKHEADGEMSGTTAHFKGEHGAADVKDGALTVLNDEGKSVATLKKVERKSPTMGEKPPAGAVVLFDGKSTDQFMNGRMTEDGLLMAGATSKQKFGSCLVHIEFRLPYMPHARGQERGNSGIYLQGRYEVQMLDSFGLEGKDNECGGIYSIKAPTVNMCLPPLSWQTYDIDYTAAQYASGKKTHDALMTVRHNGVPVQEKVELPHATTAAPVAEGPEPGPIYLQDHGTPVRYRNIWVVEKK